MKTNVKNILTSGKKKKKILVDTQLYSQTIPEISYLAMLAKKQNTLATPSK